MTPRRCSSVFRLERGSCAPWEPTTTPWPTWSPWTWSSTSPCLPAGTPPYTSECRNNGQWESKDLWWSKYKLIEDHLEYWMMKLMDHSFIYLVAQQLKQIDWGKPAPFVFCELKLLFLYMESGGFEQSDVTSVSVGIVSILLSDTIYIYIYVTIYKAR